MTVDDIDRSPLVSARVAGLLGVIILFSGTFGGIVHNKLVVPGDAETTAQNIMASEWLFRLGIMSGLVMYTIFIFYVLLLYKLLKPVNKNHALLMLVLGLIGTAIALLSQIHQFVPLLLLSNAGYLKAFKADQLHAQAMFFLGLHSYGNLIRVIFWGLWLFPLGYWSSTLATFPKL